MALDISKLGKGLGPDQNGKDCLDCEGKGYTKKEIDIYEETECTVCEGSGVIKTKPCKFCKDGKFELKSGKIVDCRACKGKGSYYLKYTNDCPTCKGKGKKSNKTGEKKEVLDKCSECNGCGEIPIFNPVIDKKIFGTGRISAPVLVANSNHNSALRLTKAINKLQAKRKD